MAQRFRLAAAVTAVAITATTFVGTASAFPGAPTTKPVQKQRASVPSAHEVKTAKLNPTAAKDMRHTLETQLTQTSLNLNTAQANAQLAWDALSAAQQRAVRKSEEAAEAKRELEAAREAEQRAGKDLGRIASETYRNGGLNVDPGELLAAENPQEILNRSDALRHLSDARARDLATARNATELAKQWDAYAQATARAAEKALGEQTEAETKAQKVAAETRVTVLETTADQNELLDRLADLNGTSRAKEAKAFQKREDERLQREFEAAQAAQREEEARAQAEAARAEAEREAAEQANTTVDGIERPASVRDTGDTGTQDADAGASDDGAASDADSDGTEEAATPSESEAPAGPSDEELAESQRKAEEEAARAAAEREAAEQAEKQRQAEEKRKQLEAEQAEAAKKAEEARKAQEEAQRKAEEAKKAERERLEREAAEREAAAKKAEEARKASEQKAKQEAARAEADRKAAEKRAAEQRAAAKKAEEARKAAAKQAAAKKAKEQAAKKAAQQRAAQQKAAAKKAAAQKAQAKKAATKKKQAARAGAGKQAALNWALNIAGSQGYGYVFGANGPRYFDCSSFVQNAFRQSGISTQRVASAQFTGAPQQVSLKNLQVGDLVFSSNNGAPSGIYHVAIYVGNGQVVHARNPRAGIGVTPISYVNNIYPLAARY